MFSKLKLNKNIGSGNRCLIFSKMRWSELPLIHDKWAKYGTLDISKKNWRSLGNLQEKLFITHSQWRNYKQILHFPKPEGIEKVIPHFPYSFRKKIYISFSSWEQPIWTTNLNNHILFVYFLRGVLQGKSIQLNCQNSNSCFIKFIFIWGIGIFSQYQGTQICKMAPPVKMFHWYLFSEM